MEKYDYLEAVKEDVRQYIKDHDIEVNEDNREDVEQELNEDCFCSDSVTGNASGSYTFSAWQAEENLCHNLDLLGEALAGFGYDGNSFAKQMESAESCDVTIRCYLLSQAISAVLDEILAEFETVEYYEDD